MSNKMVVAQLVTLHCIHTSYLISPAVLSWSSPVGSLFLLFCGRANTFAIRFCALVAWPVWRYWLLSLLTLLKGFHRSLARILCCNASHLITVRALYSLVSLIRNAIILKSDNTK
jgi:hypothetical protein